MKRDFALVLAGSLLFTSSSFAASPAAIYCHLFAPCLTCGIFNGLLDSLTLSGTAVFNFLFGNLRPLLEALVGLWIACRAFAVLVPFLPAGSFGSLVRDMVMPLLGLSIFVALSSAPSQLTDVTNAVLDASIVPGLAIMSGQESTASITAKVCPAAAPLTPTLSLPGSIIDPTVKNEMLTLLGNVESTFSIIIALGMGEFVSSGTNSGSLFGTLGILATNLNNTLGGIVLIGVGTVLTVMVPLFMLDMALRVFVTVSMSPILVVFFFWKRTREIAISVFSQLPLLFFKTILYAMVSIASAAMLTLALNTTNTNGATLATAITNDTVNIGLVDKSFWLVLVVSILSFAMFIKVPGIASQFINTVAAPGLSAGASVIAGSAAGKAAGGVVRGAKLMGGAALGPAGLAGVAAAGVEKVLERMKPKK
jgi:hypothetical protein